METRIRGLGLVGSALKGALTKFLDSLTWTDIFDLGGVWDRAKAIFTRPDRSPDQSSARRLVGDIITFVKDAILLPLAKLAEGTRGYDLLKAVLGQDPITGEAVPRTPEILIGGFMKFIGQEEVWENMQKANAIPRAWAWFQAALAGLIGFVSADPGAVHAARCKSLEIIDIILPPKAFIKLVGRLRRLRRALRHLGRHRGLEPAGDHLRRREPRRARVHQEDRRRAQEHSARTRCRSSATWSRPPSSAS